MVFGVIRQDPPTRAAGITPSRRCRRIVSGCLRNCCAASSTVRADVFRSFAVIMVFPSSRCVAGRLKNLRMEVESKVRIVGTAPP
jgi:hypothetical protein